VDGNALLCFIYWGLSKVTWARHSGRCRSSKLCDLLYYAIALDNVDQGEAMDQDQNSRI